MLRFLFVLLLFAGFSPSVEAQKRQDGIAVIVGGNVITQSDIHDRMKLILSSSGLPDQPEVRDRVRPQIIAMLTEEEIKRTEAKRLKLSGDPVDIEAAIKTIAEQNKMTPAQFTQMLGARGIPVHSLRDQIQAQILWSKVVARQIRPQVQISEQDISAEQARLQALVGQTEFLLGEIMLVPDRRSDDKDIAALAARLVSELKARPQTFPDIARQFSRAPGAAQGGMMGWVAPAQLVPELSRGLAGATKGQIIGPVKTITGTYILGVRDVRTRTAAALPTRDEISNRLGLERLDRLQRQYYQDLRGAMFIEQRS